MLQRFTRGSEIAGLTGALERDGAAVVDGFAAPKLVDRLAADFAPHLDRVEWSNTDGGLPDGFFGLRTKRLHGLLGRSVAFGELITDPLLRTLCDHFLAPHCREYRLSTGELMALGRGQESQQLHRDADSWYGLPKPRPEILVSANLALTDFTEDNGATVVVPGSHRWPREREPGPGETARAVMRRGSALLYSGDVLHGGGANATEDVRIGLYVGYIPSWLRPIETHLITNDLTAIRAAPPEAQKLLDYSQTGWNAFA